MKRLVNQKTLTLNVTVLSLVSDADFLPRGRLLDIAVSVARLYRDRYKKQDITKAEAAGDKKLLVNRVENAVLNELSSEIKRGYRGEFYEWLETESATPDPDHLKNVGKIFQIGVGEMPGERWGCKCGMRILVKEDELDI